MYVDDFPGPLRKFLCLFYFNTSQKIIFIVKNKNILL